MAVVPPGNNQGAVAPGLRVAVLVLHGIGEQVPYETLDSAGRGFAETFGADGYPCKLTGERLQHADWTEVAVHLDFDAPATPQGLRRLSLFEFYWAPYTEGKTRLASMVRWLAITALTPLRYLSANLQAELGATPPVAPGWPRCKLVTRLFGRELLRGVGIYLPFLIALGLGGLLAYKVSQGLPALLSSLLATVQTEPSPWWGMAFLILTALAVVMAVFLVQRLWARGRRVGPGIEQTAENLWTLLAAATLVAALLLAAAIQYLGWFDVIPYLGVILSRHSLYLLLLALVLALLRWVLLRFVGDIALYVNADARAESYRVRAAILRDATAALKRLLQNAEYDRVVLAGHSLGSVIAYDAITELVNQTVATQTPGAPAPLTPAEIGRLRGLVTFGSPLDKVLYFFREQVRDAQAVRAQILGRLHKFRRLDSGRDYGWLEFKPGALPATMPLPDLAGLAWLNIWAPLDPVSGSLRFYRVNVSLRRSYWLWGFAHLRYWRDQAMYELIINNLL